MLWLKCSKNENVDSRAKIVDGTLILSLPDAISPIVWRMDLSSVKSAAIEIRTDKKEGEDERYTLTMKATGEKAKDIATFSGKSQAVQALMVASQAMEQGASTTAATVANDTTTSTKSTISNIQAVPVQKKSLAGQILAAFIGLVIIGMLIFALGKVGPKTVPTGDPVRDNSQATGNPFGGGGDTGVPMSADDFLLGR